MASNDPDDRVLFLWLLVFMLIWVVGLAEIGKLIGHYF